MRKTSLIFFVTAVCFLLTSCNSFNEYDPNGHKRPGYHGGLSSLFSSSNDSEIPEQTISARDEKGRLLCPYEQPRVMPEPPALPTEQLKQLDPNNKDALIQLLLHHIDDLRLYISTNRKQEMQARRSYINLCRQWYIQHAQ